MRLWRCLPLVLSLVTVTIASADPTSGRFIIVLPSPSFGSPSTGNIVIVPGTKSFIFPGVIISSRPTTSSHPTVVVPSGYFLVQFQSGNWTIVWCEPLKTNVVIVGRPLIRPYYLGPVFAPPLLFDPSVTYGVPQIWHSPILQPGVLVFRLKHRSAEEVARLLNEARVVPDGQFSGIGNILIVSAPSLATSGVQQSRIRDLIAALDQPTEKSSSTVPNPSPVQWQVEFYRAHLEKCVSQENLHPDRKSLLDLSGYKCAHKLGETLWNPTTQGDVIVKGERIDVRVQAKRVSTGWQFTVKGKFNGQPIEFEGQAPEVSQPTLLVVPTPEGKDGLVIIMAPNPK